MTEAGGHKEISGDELPMDLAEVTKEDLVLLENLRKNGGKGTKKMLENFGKAKLGFDVNLSYSVDNILDKFLIPKLKKRLSEKSDEEDVAPAKTKEIVTLDNFSDSNAPLATPGIKTAISDKPIDMDDIPLSDDLQAASKEELIVEILQLRKIVDGNKKVSSLTFQNIEFANNEKYLKNTETGNVVAWTKILSGLKHMYPCNKNGGLLNRTA